MKIKSVPRSPGRRAANTALVTVPAATAMTLAAAPERGERGRLFVEPAQVRAEADRLGALSPRLGGTLSDLNYAQKADEEERHVVQVDPLVGHVAQVVRQDLLRYDEVVAAAGVEREAHEALAEKVAAAGESYINGLARAEEVEDGLCVVGQKNRALRLSLGQAIPLALGQGLVPEAQRPILRSLWSTLQAEEEKIRERALSARQKSTDQTQKAAAELHKAERREALVRTMLDLRKGQAVEPARADEAVRSFDELEAKTAPARRTAKSKAERRADPR